MSPFPILLVEDDTSTAELVHIVAKKSFPEAVFLHVTTMETATEYLSNVNGYGPKLALIDVNLNSFKSGLDFLTLLREHPLGKLVPAIMFSRDDSNRLAKQAYQSGASAYFHKPDSLEEWNSFLNLIRTYWYKTVSLPRTWFEKQIELI